ncbi:hypothetical protein OAG71_04215 [bacterium]|nr:hypothetical protein [bacterium]
MFRLDVNATFAVEMGRLQVRAKINRQQFPPNEMKDDSQKKVD